MRGEFLKIAGCRVFKFPANEIGWEGIPENDSNAVLQEWFGVTNIRFPGEEKGYCYVVHPDDLDYWHQVWAGTY